MKHIKLYEDFINEGRSKAELEDSLKNVEAKLRNYKGKNQNSIHPFDPQKKMKDYVAYLEDSIKYLKAEIDSTNESVVNEAAAPLDCLMIDVEADYETNSGRSAHKDFKVLVKCNDEAQAKHIHDILAHTDNIDTNEIADDVLNQMIDSSSLVGCTLSKSKSFKNEYSVEDFLSALEDNNKDLVKKLRK